MPEADTEQNEAYRQAVAEYGGALQRVARAYEANRDQQKDLLQEIHIALWRSFALFDGRCSRRTWVYRVAHNVAAAHVLKGRRHRIDSWVRLEDIDEPSAGDNPERTLGERQSLDMLMRLIQGLKPPDRQVMLLYLEDIDAASIGEIAGLSAAAVAAKIHRVKVALARCVQHGGSDEA
jgi:RNA polymerase sigma-70 factor (ECF subfamily)